MAFLIGMFIGLITGAFGGMMFWDATQTPRNEKRFYRSAAERNMGEFKLNNRTGETQFEWKKSK